MLETPRAARATATAAVSASGLTKSFDERRAVDGLSFAVEPGEVLALLGPNGAGKTTTIRLLNGVLRPDGGGARVLGLDPATDGDAVRARTGVLTENAGLDDRLTALENLVLYGRIRGMAEAAARARGGALLERFGMSARASHLVQGFSTGQRKRVALARALLHDPEVLFLDEPTSGLDPHATRDVVTLIASLAREHGRTIVLCTHFLGEADRLCSHMAVLEQGRLQAFGTPHELGAQLWRGLAVDLDLGDPAPARLLAAVRELPGVFDAAATPAGAQVRVAARGDVPHLVAALVARGVAVYSAIPRPATIEEVYFAVRDEPTGGELTGTAALDVDRPADSEVGGRVP